jgi:hypothetical protein
VIEQQRTTPTSICPVNGHRALCVSQRTVSPMGAPSRTRVTIIGGGSYQWTPKLLVDFVNTPVVRDADVVLHDIDPAPLPRMVVRARHLSDVRGVGLTARGTTDRRDALRDAEFVVVNISTGGFRSCATTSRSPSATACASRWATPSVPEG